MQVYQENPHMEKVDLVSHSWKTLGSMNKYTWESFEVQFEVSSLSSVQSKIWTFSPKCK